MNMYYYYYYRYYYYYYYYQFCIIISSLFNIDVFNFTSQLISTYGRFLSCTTVTPKAGITIVVQLKFGSPKLCFIWLCDSQPYLQL